LPWLQKVLGNFELVPIVMGDQSYESSRALGVALARMLRDDHDTLVLASSDLSHYHPTPMLRASTTRRCMRSRHTTT